MVHIQVPQIQKRLKRSTQLKANIPIDPQEIQIFHGYLNISCLKDFEKHLLTELPMHWDINSRNVYNLVFQYRSFFWFWFCSVLIFLSQCRVLGFLCLQFSVAVKNGLNWPLTTMKSMENHLVNYGKGLSHMYGVCSKVHMRFVQRTEYTGKNWDLLGYRV